MTSYKLREPEYKWNIKINLKTVWAITQIGYFIIKEFLRKKPKRKKRMKNVILVIAGTYAQFNSWCKINNRNPADPKIIYANDVRHLRGWDYATLTILYYGTYYQDNSLYTKYMRELRALEYLVKLEAEKLDAQGILKPWYTAGWVFWILWFLTLEAMAIWNKDSGDTLSEHLRKWFSFKDKSPWYILRRLLFIIIFVLLSIWFVPHIIWGGKTKLTITSKLRILGILTVYILFGMIEAYLITLIMRG